MPRSSWGVCGSLFVMTIFLGGHLHAGQEPVMRVLVLESNQLRFRADGDYPLIVDGIGSRKQRVSTLKIRQNNGQFVLAINGRTKHWSYLSPKTELKILSKDPRGIWLGKRRYRGELRVLFRGDRLKVVNHVGIEKYLVSVVGSEMPKSWPMDALKAQAVAARTYALQQLDKKNDYDVNSTESSQVYLGIESETKSTKQAVSSTRSLVLTYKGQLINAVFHSSSGGKTEASGSVWKQQMPYLVSVRDHDQQSPSYRWKIRFDPYQLEAAFSEVGGLHKIQVIRSSSTGRVLLVSVGGPNGDMQLTGKDLRRRLALKSTLVTFQTQPYESMRNNKLKSSTSFPLGNKEALPSKRWSSPEFRRRWSLQKSGSHLPARQKDAFLHFFPLDASPLPNPPPIFTLDAPSPLPPIPKQYSLLVKGAGAGHGVGMSQWGAYGLAKKGVNFRRILTHYYKGVEIDYLH